MDLRVTAENEIYFIEANPNPILAADEDFAQSAVKAGLLLSATHRADHPAWDKEAARD